jgi:hypothetical protein
MSSALVAPNMAASPDGSQVCVVGQYLGFALYESATATQTTVTSGFGGNSCAATPSLVAAAGSANVAVANSSLLQTSQSSLLDYQLGALGSNPEAAGVVFDTTGALLYVPYSDSIALFDVHTGEYRENITLPGNLDEFLYDNGTIAVDSTGSHIFVFTANGLTDVEIDALPLAIGSLTVSGSTWTIAGTGFISGTAVSADGSPLSDQFTDSQHIQITSAPALNSVHTLTLTNPDGHTYTYDVAYLQ